MAFDAFLKIDGIDGGGPDGTIEVLSFSWGLANQSPVSSGGGASGRVSASDLAVMKNFDKASPALFRACASGQHFPAVSLSLSRASRDGQPAPFVMYKFETVFVSSVQVAGSEGGGDVPTESVSLAFQGWSFGKV